MRKTNKKGSLNLSINAIVIIVLAMTMLGLGLGFVRNMFKDISGTTGTVQEQVKQQILEQLREADKPLNFPQEKINIEKKEVQTVAFGVKNTGSGPLEFTINISVSQSNPDGAEQPKFFYDTSRFTLGTTEANVYGIDITAPSQSGTHIMKIKVLKEGNPDDVYAERSVFLTVI